MGKRGRQHLQRLRLHSGELIVISTISWSYFLWELEEENPMCCGQNGAAARVEAEWWQYVRAGNVLTTFSSEADALAFLDVGFENTPERLRETWAALLYKKEQAGK